MFVNNSFLCLLRAVFHDQYNPVNYISLVRLLQTATTVLDWRT
jgi:hypothetical protein